jgi:hypothetical protein
MIQVMASSDVAGDLFITASDGEASQNCSVVDLCYAFVSGADM